MTAVKNLRRTLVCLALGGCLSFAERSTSGQAAPSDVVLPGITQPSQKSELGLNQVGIIGEVPAKNGDMVKKGQLILKQDDRAERAELQALELEAKSTVRIDAQKADLEIKKVQLNRLEEMMKSTQVGGVSASNPSEVEEARSKVILGDANVKVAELEHAKDALKAEQQRVRVDQMQLKAPGDGIIQNIDVSVGEIAEPQKPVCTFVVNNPLWVEIHMNTAASKKLKVGQSLDIRYADEQSWMPGKIIYKAPVADAASDTQLVRLELPNPNNTDSGFQILVRIPAAIAGAGSAGANANVAAK